jgi:hypothetical protein
VNYELNPQTALVRQLTNLANAAERLRSHSLASHEATDALQMQLAFRNDQLHRTTLDEVARSHAETSATLREINEKLDRLSSQIAYGFRFDFDPTEEDGPDLMAA